MDAQPSTAATQRQQRVKWIAVSCILAASIVQVVVFGTNSTSMSVVLANSKGIAEALYSVSTPSSFGQDARSPSLPPLPFPARAFWHMGNSGLETWRVVVGEQVSRLYRSGLLDAMNVTAVYVSPDNSSAPILHEPRISVASGGKVDRFEYPTLEKLQAYCVEEPTARVIYFHTKGASKSLNEPYGYNCYMWRKVMEHFTIDLHRTIMLNELNDTSPYQAAGILHKRDFYGGNFWLAKCSYINTLPRLETLNQEDRWLAESWIGSNKNKPLSEFGVSCWENGPDQCGNFYACSVPEYEYLTIDRCGGKPNGFSLRTSRRTMLRLLRREGTEHL
jgi:hypothetical protein